MSTQKQIADRLRFFKLVGRSATVAMAWLVVVGIGTACFFPPGTSFSSGAAGDGAALNYAVVFGSSMAIAGAAASAFAFAVGGKTRWAFELIFAVTLAVVFLTAVAYTCFWHAPWLARSQMDYWKFQRLRDIMLRWAEVIVRYEIALGVVVGLAFGALAGLLAILARRRPRIAMGVLLGMLAAGAWSPIHRFAFGLILSWGELVRWYIESPGMTDPLVPAAGAALGALAGAIIATFCMRWKRNPTASSRQHPIDYLDRR
jgi:MFS family permease